ncbi:MAG: hypothetical protein MK212_10910 [Saprospiraceae bacterium]|nr:hypothetical protein [Saprospiraceae bacterium]
MKQRNNRLLIGGFSLFILGTLSLILEMAGVKFNFLAWMEYFGRLGSFLFKLGFVVGGMMMVTLSVGGDDDEDEEEASYNRA